MSEKFDIRTYFSDDHPVMLDEVTYKDVLHHVDPRDLPHRDYAPLIPHVKYVGVRKDITKFFVPNKYNGWNTYVQFAEWNQVVADRDFDANEAARLLMWSGNIRLYCPCPSYKFWGYAYILTQLSASIVPETRFPHIRNPNLKGICCKHLRRTIKVLPFHLGNIASAIKKQRERDGGGSPERIPSQADTHVLHSND